MNRLFDRLFNFALASLAVAALLIALPMLFCQPMGVPLRAFRAGWWLIQAGGSLLFLLFLWDMLRLAHRSAARVRARRA